MDEEIERVSFRDQGFLMSQGLSADNVLDYFAESPFYKAFHGETSVNEKVRMGLILSVQAGIQSTAQSTDNHQMTWFELVYQNEEAMKGYIDESVFIIQRFTKFAGQKSPKEVFYVQAGTVHFATSLGKLLEKTLCKSASNLNAIFNSCKDVHQNTPTAEQQPPKKLQAWPDFVTFMQPPLVDQTQIAFTLKAFLK